MSPPTKTRRPSRRGAEMSPARRSTGATCRSHPRCCLPAALKCRRRASRRRSCETRPWARAHSRRLAPPEKTSGRFALVWRPTGWASPSRRDPRPAKPILREGQRSGQRLPASSTMALTAPTPTSCRGAGRGHGRQTRRRRRARHRWRSQALSAAFAVIAHPGRWGPGCSRVPRRRQGPRSISGRHRARGVSPRAGRGIRRPKRSSPRVGGLEAHSPRAGLVGRLVKKARMRSKM
jgi:hypothetical protein